MITVSKQENGVLFTFTNSDKYLYGSGTIEVPFNSLSIIQDESDNITLRKSASNDIFLSARYDTDFGYASKEEAVNALKEILYDEAGISEEEVQEMIDAATSGIPSSEVVEQLRTDVNTLSGTVSSHTADTTVHFTGTQKSNYDGLEVLYHAEGNWDIMPQSAFNDFTNDYSTAMGQFDQRITANETAIATKADTSALTAVQDSLSDYVTTTTYESGQYATAQALNALQENKLDASAYTPTDLSQYWTSGQTQEAINAATSGIPSSQVIEALRNDINTVSGDVENKQDALSAGTGIEISGNVISATGGALLVNFDDLMENMNDEKWDELVDALQNKKPIFDGYNNSEGDITDAGQNIVDGYVYQDENCDEFGTTVFVEVMSLKIDFSGGYRELIITKKGSEDYEVSEFSDNYQPMGDYQPAMTAGSGISIDENYVISVTGAPITVDSELDETSNNPVANSAITNAIIDNEYTVSQAINSLNNRVAAVESGGTGGGISSGEVQTMIDDSLDIYWTSAQTQTAIDGVKAYYVNGNVWLTQGITDADWDGLIAAMNAHRPINATIGQTLYTCESIYLESATILWFTASDGAKLYSYRIEKNGSIDYALTYDTKTVATVQNVQAVQSNLSGNIDSVNNALTAHTADTTVHVTQAEKETWNGKQNGLTAGRGLFINADNTISASTAVLGQGGTVGVMQIIKLTQARYDALSTKDAQTLYIVVD